MLRRLLAVFLVALPLVAGAACTLAALHGQGGKSAAAADPWGISYGVGSRAAGALPTAASVQAKDDPTTAHFGLTYQAEVSVR